MQRFLMATLSGAGILIGFFLGGCGLLMLGLAVYVAQKEGIAAGKELLLQSWPFYVGLLVFLLSAWQGFRRGTRPALVADAGTKTNA